MEPNRKKQKLCPVCCSELDSNIGIDMLYSISHTCRDCGYHYTRIESTHAEVIGGHTITWDEDIYKPKNEDLKIELEHLRNSVLAEAKTYWVKYHANANKARGAHVCYKIVT